MKTISNILIALTTSVLMSSCFLGSLDTEDETFYEEYDTTTEQPMNDFNENPNENRAIKNSQTALGQTVYDKKRGMVMAVIPFPKSWKQANSKEFAYVGPNGIKVSGEFGRNFTYNNPYGGQNTPPMNLQQIIEAFFMPIAKQTQRKLLKTYELPEVAKNKYNYLASLWEYAPSQKTVQAYGLEWEDSQNTKYITVLVLTDNKSQLGSYWTFFGQFLQAPSQNFETAKNQFIYGLANTQYNPAQIAAHNNSEIQRANASSANHNARMGALKQQGNAIANTGKIYSEISDINHNGYMNTSRMNDAGHSKSVDGIYGTTTVYNPNQSGQSYKVESYDNYYYGNNQGTVLSTDNSLYNPNLDPNYNNQDWTKYEIDN